VIAFALAGCASIGPPGAEVLSGRLSVRVEAAGNEPERSVSGGFELRGDADRGSLDLSTPIGTLLARAQWSPDQVLLVTPQGRKRYADLPALTRELLGESLPVAALFDWLRGRPWPGATSLVTSPPAGAGFRQLGWTVSLARFDDGLVEARRDDPPPVTVRARIDRP
jgi:outer membrane lipoprotein LolB